jgi:hypothetical protein
LEGLEPNKSTDHLTGAGATTSFLSTTSGTGLTGTYSSTEMDGVTLVFAAVNVTAVLAACPVDLVKVNLTHKKSIFPRF